MATHVSLIKPEVVIMPVMVITLSVILIDAEVIVCIPDPVEQTATAFSYLI
jgi:hypothetical protein